MEYEVSKFPAWIQRIIRNQDSVLGFLVVWFLALTVFPTGGFYLGTIFSNYSDANGIRHYYDLRVGDIHVGGYFALGGLALGVAFALWATFVYPKQKEVDAAEDVATNERIHQLLSHHDEIATDVGQKAEHVVFESQTATKPKPKKGKSD